MARRRRTPKIQGNIFWRNITSKMCVVDHGRFFEVKEPRSGRTTKRYVAYWDGQTARAAQEFLKRRAAKGCRR